MPLDISDGEKTFATILDRAIGAEIEIAGEDLEADPDILFDLPSGDAVRVHDTRHLTKESQAAYNREGLQAFRRALALLVNCLCYMTAEPHDTQIRLPADAPANLIEDVRNGKRSKKTKARAELLQRGFTFLHIIGNGINGSAGLNSTGEAAESIPHWRRGHWRRQPYGPGRIDVRLTWIKPTIVRADRGDPQHGHIYHVERGQAGSTTS